jgi:hypothetical protein
MATAKMATSIPRNQSLIEGTPFTIQFLLNKMVVVHPTAKLLNLNDLESFEVEVHIIGV